MAKDERLHGAKFPMIMLERHTTTAVTPAEVELTLGSVDRYCGNFLNFKGAAEHGKKALEKPASTADKRMLELSKAFIEEVLKGWRLATEKDAAEEKRNSTPQRRTTALSA